MLRSFNGTIARILRSSPLIAFSLAGCGQSGDPVEGGNPIDEPGGGARPTEPGVPVEVEIKTDALTALNAELSETETWSAEDLQSHYPVSFEAELGFDPEASLGYDTIQASDLALS